MTQQDGKNLKQNSKHPHLPGLCQAVDTAMTQTDSVPASRNFCSDEDTVINKIATQIAVRNFSECCEGQDSFRGPPNEYQLEFQRSGRVFLRDSHLKWYLNMNENN